MTPGEMLNPEPEPFEDIDTREPRFAQAAFNCPHCGAFADQTWYPLMREKKTGNGIPSYDTATDNLTPPSPVSRRDLWWQGRCRSCRTFHTWRGGRLIYPAKNALPAPHPDMPGPVVAIYTEAREVAVVSRRAGAALARATMESLLRNLLENDKDELIVLIDQVEPLVSRSLSDLLTFVRHVGNSALHVKGEPSDSLVLVLDEQTTEALNALFVIVNRLVEELITEPARTARLVGSVPETVKAKVEELRAKRAQGGS